MGLEGIPPGYEVSHEVIRIAWSRCRMASHQVMSRAETPGYRGTSLIRKRHPLRTMVGP